jgi:putative sterol carrier protein
MSKSKTTKEVKKPKAPVEEKPDAAAGGMNLSKMTEEMLNMPDKELMEALPTLVPGLKGSIPDLLNAVPDLPQKLGQRLLKSDVKKWATEAPKASDAFTEFLWDIISAMVEKDPELKKAATDAGEIKVNYEADDSPMQGQYKISGGKITGGPGKLDTADLAVSGHTDILLKLVIGGMDPMKGLMMRKFKLDGPLALGMKLTMVTKAMAQAFKGQ